MGRQIADVLRELAGGQTYDEINGALQEVVEAVRQTRKSGALTIKLNIKPNGEHAVMITDTVISKVPEATRGETLFFVDASGGLLRDDPRQEKLPLRSVGSADGTIKEIA